MATNTPPQSNKRTADDNQGSQRRVQRKSAEAPKYGKRTVAVHVDEDDEMQTFDVYEDLLVKHSDFFKAALSKPWREGKQRAVSLAEDDAELFEVFFLFVNTGQIFSSRDGDVEDGADLANSFRDVEWERLSDLWVLGNKLLAIHSKDVVVDAIISKIEDNDSVPLGLHDDLYPHSRVDSPSDLKKCPDFLFDVAVALNETSTSDREALRPVIEGSCKYHEHVAEGKPCYKTLF